MIKTKLKVVLAQREMTQTELSKRTGIRPPTLSAISTNQIKVVPMDVMDRMCKVLDCNVGDIFEYVPDEEEH